MNLCSFFMRNAKPQHGRARL